MSAAATDQKSRNKWTRLNIALHWTIVGFLILQFIDSNWIGDLFDKSIEGGDIGTLTYVMGYSHMIIGGLVFLAIATRLWDRYSHGRPPHDTNAPTWTESFAKITHFLLYAILFYMPVAGFLTWLTGLEWIAETHKLAWDALLIVAGVHIIGALVNHFYYKNDVLRRMMPGQGRKTTDL